MINHLLDIPPMPDNGLLESIEGITSDAGNGTDQSQLLIGAILATLILLGISLLIVRNLRKKNLQKNI